MGEQGQLPAQSEAVGTPEHAGTFPKRFLHGKEDDMRAQIQFFLESVPAFSCWVSSVGFSQKLSKTPRAKGNL